MPYFQNVPHLRLPLLFERTPFGMWFSSVNLDGRKKLGYESLEKQFIEDL